MIGEVTVGRKRTRRAQGGFSLIELVVGLTVTLIISGAVYQLVTAGGTAFRKEPALADRQQNIRTGMNLIAQDVFKGGTGFPQFAQVFTDDLDAVGPLGSSGGDTDELEIFMASDCPAKEVCDSPGGTVTTKQTFGACEHFPALVILGNDTEWGVFWADAPGKGTSASCDAGGGSHSRNGHAVLPHGKSKFHNPPGGVPFDPTYMLIGQVIRYRIHLEDDGTPNLERSAFGGEDFGKESSWEVIARGVEDLQVEYLNGTGWQDEPGTITCGANCDDPTPADYDTLIRRVRVRLSARAMEANLTGQSTSAVGNAPRGQLVSEVAPRAALATLEMAGGES
jgi:prepilin-type N-terminal cleavage/methylation domain-containing protein